jgi:hypothetical protein
MIISTATFFSIYDVYFTIVIKHDFVNDVVYFFKTSDNEKYDMQFLSTEEFINNIVNKQEYKGISSIYLEHCVKEYKKDIRNSNLYDILLMNADC